MDTRRRYGCGLDRVRRRIRHSTDAQGMDACRVETARPLQYTTALLVLPMRPRLPGAERTTVRYTNV